MQDLQAFKELLNSPKNIVLVTHHKPDADALGSCLGLAGVLKKMGHGVSVVTPSDYPDFLQWMKGNDEVLIYHKNNKPSIERLVEAADIIFCLDFSSLHRINELGEEVRNSKATKVLIDHHQDPEDFAEYKFWSTSAAATAELVYQLLVALGVTELLDSDIAEALYAGIMTDTGSFRHSNTTDTVHEITAELIKIGADTHKVARLVYDSNSLERLRFLGFALSQRLEVIEEYHTALFAISKEDLISFDSKTGDTEGLVNFALSIRGVILAALIIDRGEIIKLSLRSIGDFSVNQMAQKYFEGGGHQNAAGGKSTTSLQATVEKFKSILPLYKSELSSIKKQISNV
jgi:phosphoesterase RecJ-like protein